MGAWIETLNAKMVGEDSYVAPFVGAWIETDDMHGYSFDCYVAPFVGAWIETSAFPYPYVQALWSLPSWERGLKLETGENPLGYFRRSLRGSVD